MEPTKTDQKHKSNISILRWVIGNTIWDYIKRGISLVYSVCQSRWLYLQPSVTEWMAEMNLLIILALIVMFVGFFAIGFFVLSLLIKIGKCVYNKTKKEQPTKIIELSWAATDQLQNGTPYISIDISSGENQLIKCHCFIKSLELNGILRKDIKRDITMQTNRVSWSGGSDEDFGIKHIDPLGDGRINLASFDNNNLIGSLQFETAKGSLHKMDSGKTFPLGIYSFILGLSGMIGDDEFDEIPISVTFEYLEEHESLKEGRSVKRRLHLLGN